ncbi:unnamed protein product, partial [Lymnaea stagnalis]
VTAGKFCYCANSLPAVSPVADANCNVPCVGDTGQTCGGAKHVSVYQATQRISGLTIVDNFTLPRSTIPRVTTPVTIELKVDNGSEINYKLDYDDGAGRTAPNASSMLSRTYNVPGEYFVKVYASNANQTAQEQVVATTVRVDAPPGESEVTCEPVFATYEFGICTYVIWWGTSLKVNLTVSSLVETFAIEDPPLSLAGPAFQTKGVNPGNSVAAVYVMHASEFSVTGKIIGWEIFVDVLGSKTMTIMKPVCTTGNYCYSKNTCSSSPCESSTSRATTCPVNEQFCGQASKCYPGCATAVSRYASPPTGYEIVSTATVTASSTGYQYIPEATVIKVSPGYVLGLRQDAGAAVLGRTTSAADTDDTMFPSGTTVFTLSAGTSTLVRHAIKAVASAGSKVHLPFRFESAGNFVLNAVATSRTLGPQATVSVHTSVVVLDGVNATILTSPTYSKTGSPVTFTVEPHTGSDVFYNWTISDGTTVVQSRNRSIQHTFTTKGVYDVNVTTYNGVSDKSNGTTIYVQNEITSVTLTSQPTVRGLNTTVLISVANGSNYTCTYNYGDNTLPGTSGLIADPLINATKAHTYATTGTFNLNVTCANDVSNASASLDVKVQDSVTNLRLILAGANRNQDFYIEWIVDAGTDLTFTLVFDGKPLTMSHLNITCTLSDFTRVSSNRWRSDLQPGRQAAIVPLTLTASNDVSYAVIETNFTILTAIVNPRFNTTATGNITSHVPITFFANVDAGSDVNITVDYGDTTFDNYLQPQDTDWPGPRTFTHTFLNGGRFQVTATFRNAGGVHTRSVVILILVGVGVIDCDLDEYALYHPPAYVNLTFLAPSLPTEPTLTLNWGEPTSRDIRPALTLNQPYPYTYRDTGTFNVTARLENLMGSKTCTKPITVVEKLAGPAFILPFTKAAVGLPFVFQFCLFRGPRGSLCNLTYHFNDSSSPVVIQRQGEGKDGCDLQSVTYTSLSTNTLSVTATSPLETVSLSVTVAVINGIKDADVAVTVTNSNVSFTALTSFTVSYTGAVQPDGAFVRFEYGDGYVNDRQAFGASSYVYKKDGIFSTNVTVYNDASSVTKTVQVGVFKNFLNLRVQAYYLADIPFNAMTFGFNNASIVYPQNKPIYFWVTDDNKGTYMSVRWQYFKIMAEYSSSDEEISYISSEDETSTDTYTIAITARNPLHTASIAPKTIQLLELVQGFSLTEAKSQVRANENKTLLLGFNKTGTDTCVYVDYGDGLLQIFSDVLAACTLSKFSNVSASDKHKLSGLTSIDHIYGSEGYYEVRATAMNAQSQESVVLGFSISGLDCSKPSVNIHNRKVYFTNPEVYKKSERVAVRGLTNIKCVNTYDNVKSWKIEKIDELYDTVTSNISLTGVDTTKAELNLPARFLDLGLYKIHYTMTMDGAFGGVRFASTTHTYIKIVKTDLIGVMVQGGVTEIQRGTLQTLTLEPAKFSIDPDEDPKLSQVGLTTRNWTCRISGTNSNLGCTEAGFSPTSQTQNLNIGLMQLKTYQISVSLYKDTRETGADIFVTVINGDPPKSSISPAVGSVYYQMSDGYKVLKSSRVALDCDCSNCAGPSISYEWTVFLYDYRWPNGWRPLGEDDLHGRVSVQASKQISIEASLFETFNATRMRAECLITQGGMTGKVATNLQINNPPIPGNCTVSPYSRTITTESVWTLQVDGWYDEDGLQEYQFFIHTDNSTVDKQITSVKTDSGRYTLNVSLSEGPDYLNYTQTIIVKVRDTLGAIYTMNCGSVVVLPMPLSDIRALARDIKQNQLHELKKMFAEGDQKTCSEKATSIMSLLNSDSKQSRTEYAGMKVASNFANTMFGLNDADRPAFMAVNSSAYLEMIEYKKESERDDRAAVRRSLITEMTKLETKSVIAIQQVSSFFAEATIYSDEIDQSSQVRALESMTDFMLDENNIDKVPSEDIEIAIANGVAAIGGILDAAGNNGFFGTLTELDQATEDPLWSDYDTSIAALGGEDGRSIESCFNHAFFCAEMVREKAIRTMDKQIQCFSRYSVPGQAFEVNSLKMKMLMEKTDISNMQGKEVTAPGTQAGVVLPNITFISGASGSDPVVVSLSQSTNHPLRYSKAANSISSTSNFVSINLYKGDNTKLDVANLKEPVKVTIPRDINMEKPKYLTVKPMIPSWSTLMNIVVNINNTQSSLHLDFKEIEGRQFLLVIKMGKLANIANETDFDDCDMVFLMPANMSGDVDDKERFRFQLDNTVLGSFTGTLAVGIRELNYTEFDMDVSQGCLSLPRYDNGSDYFNGDFSLRQYVTQCLAISDSDSDWSTDGCVVGKETDVVNTVCYCTHLTTFAGGWVVVPNTIDWSYVFANADFLSNPTIYITVMVTALLYLIGAVWARLRDKKMSQQLGIAPLADNDPSDRYFYEVLVCTGMRRNAGTDSQVCFVLSGEDDESDVRAFTDSKRKIFRRGQVDGFLMAVPRPLGYLNFMRIWHDNSGRGKFASWYLNYIVVRDVQTDVKQVFIANKWLAVEEDDGQVDRVIPVATQEQLGDFSYQFGERSRKNLIDGHLWFSVVARPPQSRFTCLQRVSCCLCLLYVSMLANAMFYRTASTDESSSKTFSFGPFSVSPEQIFIGVISNLIVFPVNFLLIYLFRKARPHHKRPSRIDLAIKEVCEQSKQASINDIKPEVSSIFSVSKTPTFPKDPYRPGTADSRPGTAMSSTSTEQLTERKKKVKSGSGGDCQIHDITFELPWYFTIIAWVLLWVITLGSVVMVIFYGISFKDETCRKWITSLLVSFFTSVFITQPIKVFLFAVVLSIIFKNPKDEEEDEEDDEELPNIDPESELLHNEVMGAAKPKKIGYKPPDPQVLEKIRATRLKEIQMWAIIREVVIYAFFLWILMLISYRQLGAGNFLYKDTMKRVFIDSVQTDADFETLRNTDDFWVWATSGLVNGIRAGAYYNDYPPLKLRAYINDKVSRILGYATMRQLRIKPAQCEVPDQVEGLVSECNVKYEMFNQEEKSFKVGWLPMGPNDTIHDTRPEYTYTTADALDGYPYWGTLSWYSGGGYVVPLVGSKEELIGNLTQLKQERWVDRYTRAVFVEFTTYNPQVNLFAISTILAEFHPSGGVVTSYRFEPAMLLPYMTSAMLFQLVCEVVYILFTAFFIIRELRELIKTRLSYFMHFWNLVEIGIIAMSLSAIVIFFYRLYKTNDLTKAFKESNGNGYVKFQYVGYWNEMFSYMIGFLVFLATLKFLKLLRFNKKISMLSATLEHSAKALLHFGIIFLIVFMAFAQLFYLTFMHIDIEYATFISSVVSSVLMMMGKFDMYAMVMAEPILSQVFVLLYVLTVSFIIVNIFVSILNETFAVVREDISKQGNDFEIVDFMMLRFKKWTGISQSEDPAETKADPLSDLTKESLSKGDGQMTRDHVQDFPDRIERLLKSISSVY